MAAVTAPGLTGLAALIDAALPQTQCTRCGYPDCAGYAQAIASGEARINQCPPGGAAGIERLAAITGQQIEPLSPEHGVEVPRSVAFIDENWCIGCTLCVKICPTDAIIGASKLMHTVIEPYCTGCELCLPVCPVDCIHLENASGTATGWSAWSTQQAHTARERYGAHQQRYADEWDPPDNDLAPQTDPLASAQLGRHTTVISRTENRPEVRQATITAVLERARLNRTKPAE